MQKINNNIKIFYSSYKLKNIEDFKDKEIIAFAGIGNPSNFFDLLKENSLNVKKVHHFPDHYNYSDKDFEDIFKKNYNYDNTKIVTTKKDYFRLNEKQKLMCNYIDIDLSANPYSGTVLHLACRNGHFNVAEVILKNSKTIKIDFNARLVKNSSKLSVYSQ